MPTTQTPRKSLLELDNEVYGGAKTALPVPSVPPINQRPKKSLLELDDEMFGGAQVKSQPSTAEKVLNNPIVSGIEKVGSTIGNFGVGVAKGVMDAPRLAAQGGANLSKFVSEDLMGQKPNQVIQGGVQEATKPISYAQPSNPTQRAGYSTEKVAEFFAPGPGAAAKGAGLLSKFLRSSVDTGVRTLGQGSDVKTAGQNAALAGAGEIVAKGAGLLSKYLSPALQKSAEKVYSRVLGPTTNENKAITQKIVPEMLDRGVWGMSRESLDKQLAKQVANKGQAIENTVSNIPSGSTVNTSNVMSKLDEVKQNFMVDGPNGAVVADPQAVKHIEDMQAQLAQMSSNVGGASYAPFESVRKFRQILDRSVAESKGFYGKTLSEGSLTDAKREAANAIRAELAREYPDLAKINAEFNFWSNAQKVLADTIQRKSGQARPLTETIKRTAGAMTGGAIGGPGGAVAGDIIVGGLSKLVDSTAWQTLGSIQKSRLAKLIGDGALEEASKYISLLMASQNKKGGY